MSIPRYENKASRLEYCIIRCIYGGIVLFIGGIASLFMMIGIAIFGFINFFTILLAGSRNETFYNLYRKVSVWGLKLNFYMAGATDQRPPLTPFQIE